MMVVELMASIPPRKMQSMCVQPNILPTVMPDTIMQNMIVQAAMTGAMPIFRIFLNEKSRPSANNRNITPMSAHALTLSMSTTDIV